MRDKIKYLIALSQLKGIGFRRAHQIIQKYGTAQDFIHTCVELPEQVPMQLRENCSPAKIREALAYSDMQLKYCQKHKVRIVCYEDDAFPYRLKRYDDSPLILYCRGKMDLNAMRTVGIVGTRNMTSYGKWMIEDLIQGLVPYDVVTISGLAYGVDTHAHRCSVVHGLSSIGVMGTGIDQIYPTSNRDMAIQMTRNGGVITEYGIRTKAEAYHFPARNRIIAALSDAMVIVESKEKGGAMITADLAFGYGKDVFAYPGKTTDTYSRGTNFLIKSQKAQLIENGQDLVDAMSWTVIEQNLAIQPTLFTDLSEDEKFVLTKFEKNTPFHIDQAITTLPFSSAETAGILLQLELKGILKVLPGSRYIIV